MTNTHIHITRSLKLHLGNGKVRNCDTTNRWNDPGYHPSVNGSLTEGIKHELSKGRDHIEERACKRCFANSDAYEVMQELASK